MDESSFSSFRQRLKGHIDVIEEAYDFMLAYAAQGSTGAEPGGTAAEIRDILERADAAVVQLVPLLKEATQASVPQEAYCAFIAVLDADALATHAGIQLILVQKAISSQLIDNMNAWIHLRALLTDLFLIDEILSS